MKYLSKLLIIVIVLLLGNLLSWYGVISSYNEAKSFNPLFVFVTIIGYFLILMAVYFLEYIRK